MSQFSDTITIAAETAEGLAPIVGIFNPAIGTAIALLTPVAATFLIKADQLVITFKQDMTREQMVEALNASKSANWPTPPSIVQDAVSAP